MQKINYLITCNRIYQLQVFMSYKFRTEHHHYANLRCDTLWYNQSPGILLFANSLFFLGRQMYYKSTMKLTEGAICLTNYSQNNYTFILIPASSAFWNSVSTRTKSLGNCSCRINNKKLYIYQNDNKISKVHVKQHFYIQNQFINKKK